jgi:hypothetical protein
MPKFNSTFATTLAPAANKKSWIDLFNAGLGTNRILRIIRDTNANATDPATTGVEVLRVGNTGVMTGTSGNIRSFGVLKTVTTRVAADLSSGSSVVRIEGNGNWAEFTVGLPGSGKEFILSSNLTAATGIAFGSKSKLTTPRLLPSGTGPVAPLIKDTTPTIIELEDWTDPAHPVVVGSATFSLRQDDFVFQDPTMAAEIGDVAIYQLNDTIKWNHPHPAKRFELGGLLMIAANYNSENGLVQLEQMLCSFKPYGRWVSYPAMDTFIRAHRPLIDGKAWPQTFGPVDNDDVADRTNLPPFKINLKTAAGVTVFTHEMKAFNDKPVLPINSPLLSETQTLDEPSIPRFNCAQMLPWQNIRTRLSSKASVYFAGVDSFAIDGAYAAKAGASVNGYYPLGILESRTDTAGSQLNSFNHWYALGPYPLKYSGDVDNSYLAAYEARPKDPLLFTNRDYYPWYRATGYKYQPGSNSGHDWITGKGGQRFDRCVAPPAIAIYAANQNWVRPEGSVPIRDLVDNWGLAYFNHSNHYVRDVKTFATIPKEESLAGSWVIASGYYGSGPYAPLGQPMGPQNTVDVCGIGNGRSRWASDNDPDGFMYYAGWQRDSLHSYANAAWYAVMLNSPMHAIAARDDFNMQWMCSLGNAKPTTDPTAHYQTRVQAWRFLAYTMQWKVGTEHSLSYSQDEIEARFQIELELMYDKIYKPAFIDLNKGAYFGGLRNLGMCTQPPSTGNNLSSAGGTLGLYMVHVLVLMRQFGLWATMRNRSFKCKTALDMMIRNLDMMTIDYIMDTDMRDAYYPVVAMGKTNAWEYTADDVPTNWVAQKAQLDLIYPVIPADASNTQANDTWTGQKFTNFFVQYNGRAQEHDGCPHLYMQYLKARKLFFPEIAAPRLDAAITKLQGYYDTYEAKRNAGLAYRAQYNFPGHGVLLAAPSLGPYGAI